MIDYCVRNIENDWKAKTNASNESFNLGDFQMALSGYKAALNSAEVLNNYFADCKRENIPFVHIYIISCNNIANTYEELQKCEEAENMLKRAVYYLLYLKENKILEGDVLQSVFKRTSLAYISFIKKNNLVNSDKIINFNELKERFELN